MKILLVGSSIFEQWFCADAAFPRAEVINKAVGGTQTEYWVSEIEAALEETKPDLVAYYCGSNDLNWEVPLVKIIENTLLAFSAVNATGTSFVYYNIIKAPQKNDKYDVIDEINDSIAEAISGKGKVMDFNPILYGPNIDIDALYVEDLLHLTPEAYRQMSQCNAEHFFRA